MTFRYFHLRRRNNLEVATMKSWLLAFFSPGFFRGASAKIILHLDSHITRKSERAIALLAGTAAGRISSYETTVRRPSQRAFAERLNRSNNPNDEMKARSRLSKLSFCLPMPSSCYQICRTNCLKGRVQSIDSYLNRILSETSSVRGLLSELS